MSSYNNLGLGNSSSSKNSNSTVILVVCGCCCCCLVALLAYAYFNPTKVPWLAGLLGRKPTTAPTFPPGDPDDPPSTWPPLGTYDPTGTPNPTGTPKPSGTPKPPGFPWPDPPVRPPGPPVRPIRTTKPTQKPGEGNPHVCAARPGCTTVRSSAPTPFCKQGATCYRCKNGTWGVVHPKWCAGSAVEKFAAFDRPAAPLPFNGP